MDRKLCDDNGHKLRRTQTGGGVALLLATILCCYGPQQLFGANKASDRIKDATEVFSEAMQAPDNGVPQDLLDKAHCVVIIPGLTKLAFVGGGQYGKGFAMCRSRSANGWSAPAAVRIEGGSVGFQIGASSTDLILLVMNKRGMERLLSSRFTLGAEATVAAGPVGRHVSAETDAQMGAEILSWARSRGAFAGVSLGGATLRPDDDDNRAIYHRELTNREILTGDVKPPHAAKTLLGMLEHYSPREL